MNFFAPHPSTAKFVLQGKVETGIGNFSGWMERFEKLYTEKTGVKLFPGTLNVRLDSPFYVTNETYTKQLITIRAGEQGYGITVYILPCQINGLDAFILRPEGNEKNQNESHSADLIEIACTVKLRDTLNVVDGDVVKVIPKDNMLLLQQTQSTGQPHLSSPN